MSAPPYMKLYVAEWTADTQHLTCEQDGAYGRLVRALWRAGGEMTATPDQLARIVGMDQKAWARIAPDVLVLFRFDGGKMSHKRLQKEAKKYREIVRARSLAGKKGGVESGVKRRKNKAESDEAKAKQKPSNCSHNQNQNQTPYGELINSSPIRRPGPALALVADSATQAPADPETQMVDPEEFKAWALDFAAKARRR